MLLLTDLACEIIRPAVDLDQVNQLTRVVLTLCYMLCVLLFSAADPLFLGGGEKCSQPTTYLETIFLELGMILIFFFWPMGKL